ncbi:hypothetical protein Tco_0235454, partial [Tanacetum coccineum]
QKRACFTTPTGRFEVRESSPAAAARQAGHTLAHRVNYGFVDTSIRTSKCRAITAIEEVNDRIRALYSDINVLQRQSISDEDVLMTHIKHKHDRFRELIRTAEAGPQDGPEDAGSSC